MKNRTKEFAAALLFAASACLPLAAMADAPASKSVCLQTYLIDHTKIQDDKTVLFYMRGGAVWQNTLVDRCVGLRLADGFSYVAGNNEICSNLQSIRLLREGNTCLLGEFTPVAPVPK